MSDELTRVIEDRISGLRPKLLELTRRNPLISTNFSERSHTLLRVVDELPDFIYGMLSSKQTMEFVALPPLDQDPKDEQTEKFLRSLEDARLTDQEYIEELESAGSDDDSAELLSQAERDLKDRVREQLGMPERQTRANLSIKQHAINNQILPGYELPLPDDHNDNGEYYENEIQTLLLSDMLERRAGNVLTKQRTWIQETGINVLHAVFGFLEWRDIDHSDNTYYAPLLLLSVQLEKKSTPEGFKFSVSSPEEVGERNEALAEKLKYDFGIDLPEFNGLETPEQYFAKIAEMLPRGRRWKVKRQVAIGVFPSAGIAMYHDLNPANWNYAENPVLSDLIGGTEGAVDASFYGDEYDVDDPNIEAKVPVVVADIDSSQFSAVVDVADGKNLAIEGPPGSGKSQTIVNAIASALDAGKKVLFVAEKTAALDVVRSRLEAWGLGEFVLPLLANRSARKTIIETIKNRIDLPEIQDPYNLDRKINSLKQARSQLKDYIDVLSAKFGVTDLTVYDILGKYINNHETIDQLPVDLGARRTNYAEQLTIEQFKSICDLCQQIDIARQDTTEQDAFWENATLADLGPFTVEAILQQTQTCADQALDNTRLRQSLQPFGIDVGTSHETLQQIQAFVQLAEKLLATAKTDLLGKITSADQVKHLRNFFSEADGVKKTKAQLLLLLKDDFDQATAGQLRELASILEQTMPGSLVQKDLDRFILEKRRNIVGIVRSLGVLKEFLTSNNEFRTFPLSSIISASDLIHNTPRSVIAGRKNQFLDLSIKTLFIRYRTDAVSLVERRMVLQQLFALNTIQDIKTVNDCAQTISQAGLFAPLVGKYRKAKSYYRFISKGDKFNKKQAVEELKALVEWLADNRKFIEDDRLKMILGVTFDGIDTNFDAIQAVFDYYEQVDQIFPGIANKAIRDFLKQAEYERLYAVPVIVDDHPLRKRVKPLSKMRKEKFALLEQILKPIWPTSQRSWRSNPSCGFLT